MPALSNLFCLQGDFKFDPKATAEGRMWTPGAVDFFRILNEQVAVVAEINQDFMLLRVGQVSEAAPGSCALLHLHRCSTYLMV